MVLGGHEGTYLASLSTWSPKPGVSTIVSEIRVPSSSNSSSDGRVSHHIKHTPGGSIMLHTNCQRLNLDTFLDVGAIGIVRVLVCNDGLTAKSVDEGSPAWNEKSLAGCQMRSSPLAMPG